MDLPEGREKNGAPLGDANDVSSDDLAIDTPLDEDVVAIARASAAKAVEETPNERKDRAEAETAHERVKWAKQRTVWRRIVFWGVVVVVAIVAASSVLGGWIYLLTFKDDAHPAVVATWIGSSVVQVVGLLAVITRHLFPNGDE